MMQTTLDLVYLQTKAPKTQEQTSHGDREEEILHPLGLKSWLGLGIGRERESR